jgi:hypothetical protein
MTEFEKPIHLQLDFVSLAAVLVFLLIDSGSSLRVYLDLAKITLETMENHKVDAVRPRLRQKSC